MKIGNIEPEINKSLFLFTVIIAYILINYRLHNYLMSRDICSLEAACFGVNDRKSLFLILADNAFNVVTDKLSRTACEDYIKVPFEYSKR